MTGDIIRCPKCDGLLFPDRYENDWFCAQCGWRPIREPTEEEMRETARGETARLSEGG